MPASLHAADACGFSRVRRGHRTKALATSTSAVWQGMAIPRCSLSSEG